MSKQRRSSKTPRNGKNLSRNNYQDAFSDAEYDKGYNAGKSSKRANADRSKKGKGKTTFKGGNSIDWYTASDQLLKDVANIPFSIRNGRPISLFPEFRNQFVEHGNYDVPGVMALYTAPTVGEAKSVGDPINLASDSLYAYIRAANSGTAKNYEPQDVMMTILAIDGVYSYIAFCCRLYGLAGAFSMLNEYTPRALFSAMRVDYENFVTNMANFRTWLNMFILQAAAFPVPKDIKYFLRHQFLFENIYTDSSNEKGQYYLYTPSGFYQYSEGTPTSPASLLTYIDFIDSTFGDTAHLKTVDELIQYGESLLRPLRGSEDVKIISGDIIKAFGDNLFKLAQISETYSVSPKYDQEILMQIENCTILTQRNAAVWESTIGQHVEVNNSYLEATYRVTGKMAFSQSSNSQFSILSAANTKECVINMHMSNPSAADVMVATRLTNMGLTFTTQPGNQWNGPYDINPCGSEVIISACIYYYNVTDEGIKLQSKTFAYHDTNVYLISHTDTPTNVGGTTTITTPNFRNIIDRFNIYSQLSKFDWHPQVRPQFIFVDGAQLDDFDPTAWKFYRMQECDTFVDLDNYAVIDDKTLANMHKEALYAMLTCGSIGAFKPSTTLR